MIFIKDGNLIRGVRILLILLGIGAIYIAVQFITPPSGWGIALMLIGLVLMAIGGYASRAAMLNLKPFDNSYQKARKSYDQKENGQ